jgi:hypothetical protein
MGIRLHGPASHEEKEISLHPNNFSRKKISNVIMFGIPKSSIYSNQKMVYETPVKQEH